MDLGYAFVVFLQTTARSFDTISIIKGSCLVDGCIIVIFYQRGVDKKGDWIEAKFNIH